MIIPWKLAALEDKWDSDLTLLKSDLKSFPESIPDCFYYVIEDNKDRFSKEEIELINNLVKSKDKDNILITYEIITAK